jgi:membrane protease YdiL (CAAX protease family)
MPIVLGVFIQAVGEELIFRGYLLQQLAVRFRSPIIWAFLPALVFGLLHYNNPGGPDSALPEFQIFGFIISEPGALYVLTTAITGTALAALVWRAGSLWPAAGLHVAVNVFSLTMVGAEGTLSGTQLWLFALDDMTKILWINVIASTILLIVLLSPIGRLFVPVESGAKQSSAQS